MVVWLRRQVTIFWLTKPEPKLKVYQTVFHRDVQSCVAFFASPHLHNFPNTVEEESFLSLVVGYVRGGVHGVTVGRSLKDNHCSYLKTGFVVL